jgi:lipid A 3-O-deacylase
MKHLLNHRRSLWAAVLIAWSSLLATSAHSQTLSSVLTPTSVFAQIGAGDQQTQAYLLGATWDLNWNHQFGVGTVGAYFEGAFGRWTTRNNGVRSTAWPTQISVTPVVRFRPITPTNPWFAELGVGANYIVPVFRSGQKRFSTEFNFGDHFAIGRDFGEHRRQELALRFEHFSNAGLAHPNPGENFVQIRYAYRLHE